MPQKMGLVVIDKINRLPKVRAKRLLSGGEVLYGGLWARQYDFRRQHLCRTIGEFEVILASGRSFWYM